MTSALPFATACVLSFFPISRCSFFFLGTIMRYRKAPFTYSSFLVAVS